MGGKRTNKGTKRSKPDEDLDTSELSELKIRLETLEGDYFSLQDENKKLSSKLIKQEKCVAHLTEELNRERARVDKVCKDINQNEQYTRLNSIRIFGVDDRTRDERPSQTEDKVITISRNYLGVTIDSNEIEACHRLGRFTREGNRHIIVKFCSRKSKAKIIAERYRLKGKSIVICEDLTHFNFQKLKRLDPLTV